MKHLLMQKEISYTVFVGSVKTGLLMYLELWDFVPGRLSIAFKIINFGSLIADVLCRCICTDTTVTEIRWMKWWSSAKTWDEHWWLKNIDFKFNSWSRNRNLRSAYTDKRIVERIAIDRTIWERQFFGSNVKTQKVDLCL